MPSQRQITRDISYAYSAQTRGGRALIKLMENATGRVSLIKRARGYEGVIGRCSGPGSDCEASHAARAACLALRLGRAREC